MTDPSVYGSHNTGAATDPVGAYASATKGAPPPGHAVRLPLTLLRLLILACALMKKYQIAPLKGQFYCSL